MNEDIEAQRQAIRKQMEQYGAGVLRTMLESGQWPSALNHYAWDWLKEKDQEAERLTADSQAGMAATASRAAAAAERAAAAAESQADTASRALNWAKIANAIAAVAVTISIYAALHSHP